MTNRISSMLGTFQPEAGVSVRQYPSLLRAAKEAQIHINALRLMEFLPCESLDDERIRVVALDEWESTVQQSPHAHIRNAIGMYQAPEHACFIKDGCDSRSQLGKVLTHEMVHAGSHGGMYEYSRALNEGITEHIARIIFKHSVGKKVFDTQEDPSPFYTHEHSLWKVLQWSQSALANALKTTFWNNDPEHARSAVRHHLGEILCNSLEQCPCTPDDVQEIIRTLVKICPTDARKALEFHAPEAIILSYAWGNLPLKTTMRFTKLTSENRQA